MMDISPTAAALLMFVGLLLGLATGFPLGLVLWGVGLLIGFLAWGPQVFEMSYARIWGTMTEYVFLAGPLFIFMGMMVEKSGIAENVFESLYITLGKFRGGLAIATILLGTILAACVGVIAASVTMLGLIALPPMLKRGYSKEVATSACCASGVLGILIPPSIMLVLYGPIANVSVGRLFMAAFMPGFLLSFLYCIYIAIRAYLRPNECPVISNEEAAVPLRKKLYLLTTSIIPPLFLIVAVLGTIFLGIAAPTEAAAVGALAATLLAFTHRSLNFKVLKETCFHAMKVFCMIIIVVFGASIFSGIFMALNCGTVVRDFVVAAPFGKWGIFFIIMVIIFILGMFIDWLGIVMILVPVVTPIADALGFDRLWFSMMIIVNLQMSFLSPPFAWAIFIIKGIASQEMGITTNDIIKGVIPYIVIILFMLLLMSIWPQIILWLPNMMIRTL
ncbi:MAG: TRAP transporter large permease subunit [Dehalococcoidales bacterium]|nr:TRAP transporter large permease subunit [Dehalococcoidales bacterium]